jgi:hypothetical protein
MPLRQVPLVVPTVPLMLALLAERGHAGAPAALDDGTPYVRADVNDRVCSVVIQPPGEEFPLGGVQFYAWFDPGAEPLLEQANRWNAEHLYVKASVSDNGKLELALDAPFDGPVPRDWLLGLVDLWAAAMDAI